MAPYVRTVVTRSLDGPGGTQRHWARLDDHFHGFEVTVTSRGGSVLSAEATSHRHPWTTCPGALPAVTRLRGPLADAGPAAVALGREHTCVHVNDLVWLASRGHRDRRYDVEVTPFGLTVQRDAAPLLAWRLDDWTITGPTELAGLTLVSTGWSDRLAALAADDDLREAVRVARRALAVGMGYFALDWPSYDTAADIDWSVMAGTCHTFTDDRVATGRRLAEPPDTTLFTG